MEKLNRIIKVLDYYSQVNNDTDIIIGYHISNRDIVIKDKITQIKTVIPEVKHCNCNLFELICQEIKLLKLFRKDTK